MIERGDLMGHKIYEMEFSRIYDAYVAKVALSRMLNWNYYVVKGQKMI